MLGTAEKARTLRSTSGCQFVRASGSKRPQRRAFQEGFRERQTIAGGKPTLRGKIPRTRREEKARATRIAETTVTGNETV